MKSGWFSVRIGLYQGVVISLFKIYIDSSVKNVNVRMLGRSLSLINFDDREWKIN